MKSNEDEPKTIRINPVGQVICRDQEGFFAIKIYPEFLGGLDKMNLFSHVMILWWADRHDNPAGRKTIHVPLPYAAGTGAGVFACRSESRPNPIGVTVMPILSVDEKNGLILLPWIDAFDGTPVLDLKPYLPVSDRVRDVRVAGWMKDWPMWMEEAGAYFAQHATDFGS